MKKIRKIIIVLICLICVLHLTACESFYEMFVDEESADDGVYSVIYNDKSTDEQIAAIPDVHLMRADMRNEIKTYGLSYEVTVAFDLETSNEASFSCYYYHNRNDENASDYCQIGMSFLGTYTMEDNKILFHIEPEGYNTAICKVGSDYADIEAFQAFSYAEDKSNGVWAYEYAPWEYEEEAVILEDILKDVPENIEITVSGSKIVTWKAAE